MALPNAPEAVKTSTSTVGFPLESITSRPRISTIVGILFSPYIFYKIVFTNSINDSTLSDAPPTSTPSISGDDK